MYKIKRKGPTSTVSLSWFLSPELIIAHLCRYSLKTFYFYAVMAQTYIYRDIFIWFFFFSSIGSCCGCSCVLSCFSCVWLFATPWTVAHQAPLSMGSRQEYWSGLSYPPLGDLPDQGIETASPVSPTLHVDSLPLPSRKSLLFTVWCFVTSVPLII